ncbi:hypothetical protein MGN70_000957 [Eutypa lata]|nr:hypothetical protein MGN70_000957 [Eutypa lata]
MTTHLMKAESPEASLKLDEPSPMHIQGDIPILYRETDRSDGFSARSFGQGDGNSSAYRFFSPGGPPIIISQNLASSQPYNDSLRDPDSLTPFNTIDYQYQLHPPGPMQTSIYTQTGERNPANSSIWGAGHGMKVVELRRKNKELRRRLSQTKHQLMESQLKTVQIRQAIEFEVDLVSEFLEEALQLIDAFNESYMYLKLIEARSDKIREIIGW